MQVSFVMLIFLLFSNQIFWGAKVSEGGGGGKLLERGAYCSPCGRKPANIRRVLRTLEFSVSIFETYFK